MLRLSQDGYFDIFVSKFHLTLLCISVPKMEKVVKNMPTAIVIISVFKG